MKPLIAITADTHRVDDPDYLATYKLAVEKAGGEPAFLQGVEETEIESVLDRFDGLLLPGGEDIDPAEYGSRDHPTVCKAPAALDRLEIAAARAALRLDLPTFAICRGIQVMNVALGGTLFEDIPDQYRPSNGPELRHKQTPEHSRHEATHPVDFQDGSTLAHVLGSRMVLTNSMHHQGLRRLAHDLVPVGRARDGIVEAVEARSNQAFYIGVQWHPEEMVETDEPSRKLFSEFVDRAASRARRRAPRV